MNVIAELRKWLPVTLITIAVFLAVLFTWRFIDRPPTLHDPMQEFLE